MSGGARVIADYAAYLVERGHDVRVVAQPVKAPTLGQRVKGFFGRAPANGHGKSVFIGALGERFSRLPVVGPVQAAHLPDADVVVACFWTTAVPVAKLPPSKGAKAYFMQDYGAVGQPIELVRDTWRLGLKVVTINEGLKQEVEEISGEPALVIMNGVDPRVAGQHERAFRSGPPTVGFVYSNNQQKGSRHCIAAIELAAREVPDLRAIAFGPAPPADDRAIPEFIEYRCGLTDEEVQRTYASSDIWLFGSLREGFGLPVLEALSNGTPVVASRAAAAPDVLAHGGGFLVTPGEPAEMAESIVRICRMGQAEWLALSKQGQATAARFSITSAREAFEAALQAVADNRWNEHCQSQMSLVRSE